MSSNSAGKLSQSNSCILYVSLMTAFFRHLKNGGQRYYIKLRLAVDHRRYGCVVK